MSDGAELQPLPMYQLSCHLQINLLFIICVFQCKVCVEAFGNLVVDAFCFSVAAQKGRRGRVQRPLWETIAHLKLVTLKTLWQ